MVVNWGWQRLFGADGVILGDDGIILGDDGAYFGPRASHWWTTAIILMIKPFLASRQNGKRHTLKMKFLWKIMKNYGDLHHPDERKIRGLEGSSPVCTKLLSYENEVISTTGSRSTKRVSFFLIFVYRRFGCMVRHSESMENYFMGHQYI